MRPRSKALQKVLTKGDYEVVAWTLERAGISGGSNAAGRGCKMRFPSRGGVDLLMNSILVGSLDAACRRT